MAALFFLAFAFFAVGQAAVVRNTAQTAADSAALAAARADRDAVRDDFLAALKSGDLARLGALLNDLGSHSEVACPAAYDYAQQNDATVTGCDQVSGPPGYTIAVRSIGTVGTSVVDGTETKHAKATATAVIQPRCTLGGSDGGVVAGATGGAADGGAADGGAADGGGAGGGAAGGGDGGPGAPGGSGPITFTCEHGDQVRIDPTPDDFILDLSTFYTVHLSKVPAAEQ